MRILNDEEKVTKLFKPYLVKREHGQCQILIPLIELDKIVSKIIEVLDEDIK